jgi:rhodanese-related sulfurtransferase
MNAALLAKATSADAFILDGGIEAWKKAGLPVALDRKQPIEMMRQVQIAAGSMALLGAVLGYLVHPGFYALAGFTGAGLMFSGVTGTCAMARMLKRMPWNRATA